jgi:hypothetical protein
MGPELENKAIVCSFLIRSCLLNVQQPRIPTSKSPAMLQFSAKSSIMLTSLVNLDWQRIRLQCTAVDESGLFKGSLVLCSRWLCRKTDTIAFVQKYTAITQPKLTDLDRPFWLAPMPLYVSQIMARLNFGSASIRLHLHGSGSFLMSSVTPSFSTFYPPILPCSPCPTDIDPESVPLRL